MIYTRKYLLPILLVVVSGIFFSGVLRLLILRYQAGDVYPAYSSLRSDPLGTKALYEGINDVRGVSSQRKYKPVNRLKSIRNATLFYLGIKPSYILYADKASVQTFEQIISAGSRLVMSFFPRTGSPFAWFEEEQKEQEEEEQEEQEQNKDSFFDPPLSFAEEWGFRLRYDLMDHAEAAAELAETFEQNPFKLPKAISWHTSLYFEITDPQIWRVLYTRDGYPVIIEREFGKGSIVFSADSYFFSNEAMRKERYPELLTWLVGSHPTIIFDETHFGIRENPGIAALIRKYRLGWFVAGLVLLAGLFVWQNAFSFVPPLSDTRQERIDSGKGVTEGLINLLRRNIASKDILKICFDEWKKSFFTHHRKIPEKAYDQVKTILEAEQTRPLKKRNSVECYNRIAKILKTVNFTLSS